MHGCLLICALFTEIQVIPVGKGLGLGLCVRRHARPKILTCGGTMLRAVFLLHICSNYYIYVVELTKALGPTAKVKNALIFRGRFTEVSQHASSSSGEGRSQV